MKHLNRVVLFAILSVFSTLSFSQAAPIRGEVSAGNYVNLKADANGYLLVGTSGTGAARGPEGTAAGEKVALSNVTASSAAITGTFIDVSCDVDCYVVIAAAPTAVAATSYKIISYTTYRFPITSGNKIAGILASGTGNLWVHPVQ